MQMYPSFALRILRKMKTKFLGHVVQDCPPELAACQVCQRFDCTNLEWQRCEKRIAAMRSAEKSAQLEPCERVT